MFVFIHSSCSPCSSLFLCLQIRVKRRPWHLNSFIINFLPFPFNTLVLGFSFFFILHVVREGLSIVYTPGYMPERERKQKNSLSSLKKHKTEKAGTRFQKFKTQQCLSSFVFLVWHKFSPLFLLPSSISTSFSSSFFACHLPNFVFLLDQNYFFSLLAIFFIQSLNSIPINLPFFSRFFVLLSLVTSFFRICALFFSCSLLKSIFSGNVI